jgi:hypothetical protein
MQEGAAPAAGNEAEMSLREQNLNSLSNTAVLVGGRLR